jgi:hypothetical protein
VGHDMQSQVAQLFNEYRVHSNECPSCMPNLR